MLEAATLLAQQTAPLIRRLDPLSRAKVLAALTALLILGATTILLVWLIGRATRRYMNAGWKPPPTTGRDRDDWARKPLLPPADEPRPPPVHD